MSSLVIASVPSGTIEIVFNGVYSTLQFNCSCDDALPFCRAMCCRLRSGYNVVVTDAEAKHLLVQPHPAKPQLRILQHNPTTLACTYLDDHDRCRVQSRKPAACTQFHCSPRGVGTGIQFRGNGFTLMPNGGSFQDNQ